MKDFDIVFDSSVKAISKVFSNICPDVMISLFASKQQPNLASPIKHNFYYPYTRET